jgi:subtilisin family serine protease
MIQKIWVLAVASVLISVILIEGQAFAVGTKKIVVFVDGTSEQEQQDTVAAVALLLNPLNPEEAITVVHTLSFINALAIEVLNANQVVQAVNLLLAYTTLVQRVDDDLPVSVLPITPAPPPPVQMYDWGQTHIRADVAHEQRPTVTGAGVKVAVLDTGVGPHIDLPTITEGYNALPPGGVSGFSDGHGHGTHIAGIIAAREDNNAGLIGAAPQVQTQAGANIVAVKVLDNTGKGYLSDVIKGLQWVYDHPQIQLVNMSLGFSTDSYPLRAATQKLFSDNGTIMVASAGNRCSDDPGQDEGGGAEGENCDTPQTDDVKYPAGHPWVLAVTAIDINYQTTPYSLFMGSKIDIAAPGGIHNDVPILSTCPLSTCGTLYGWGSGTSQAAAHVTGAIALEIQQLLQQNKQISLSEVKTLLCQNAKNLGYPANRQGCGLVDVEKMLAAP